MKIKAIKKGMELVESLEMVESLLSNYDHIRKLNSTKLNPIPKYGEGYYLTNRMKEGLRKIIEKEIILLKKQIEEL